MQTNSRTAPQQVQAHSSSRSSQGQGDRAALAPAAATARSRSRGRCAQASCIETLLYVLYVLLLLLLRALSIRHARMRFVCWQAYAFVHEPASAQPQLHPPVRSRCRCQATLPLSVLLQLLLQQQQQQQQQVRCCNASAGACLYASMITRAPASN
jgi:hypothetical protein